MIVDRMGRARSVQTREELERLVQDDLASLSEEDAAVLMEMIGLLSSDGDAGSEFMSQLQAVDYRREPVDIETFVRHKYFLGETCADLYPVLMEDLKEIFDGYYNEVIFSGSIDVNSLIQEADGGLPTLRERIGAVSPVSVLLDNGMAVSETEPAHSSGIKQVLELTLQNGMRLLLTPDHEVRVWRNLQYEWVPAADLKSSDWVVTPAQVYTTPSSSITPEEAAEAAMADSEANSAVVDPRVCKGSNEALCEYMRVAFSIYSHLSRVRIRHTPKGAPVISSVTYDFRYEHERYVRQIQLLLLRFGIQARIGFKPRKGRGSNQYWYLKFNYHDIYRCLKLFWTDANANSNVDLFMSLLSWRDENIAAPGVLPFSGKEVRDKLTSLGARRKSVFDHPAHKTVRRERKQHRPMPRNQLMTTLDGRCGRNREAREFLSRLRSDMHEDAHFEKIKSLQVVTCSIPVGDIGAHNGNRFIANGISVHNSIGYGKCVDGGTEVYDVSTGERRTVRELSSVQVCSYTESNRAEVRRASVFPSGRKQCVNIVLCGGQSTILSLDHPVLTGRGWIPAGRVSLDDVVATPESYYPPDREAAVSDECVIAEALRVMGSPSDTRIQSDFYGLSERHVALFLRQIMSVDLSLGARDLVYFDTNSDGLARDVQFLLGRIGMTASFSPMSVTGRHSTRVTPHEQHRMFREVMMGRDVLHGEKRFFRSDGIRWERVLSKVDAGEREVFDLSVPGTHNFVANGMIVHNTFVCSIGVCYVLYLLSCMYDPAASFALAPETPITIIGLSASEDLAKEVVLKNVIGKIANSQYFRDNYKPKITQRNIRFPNNVTVWARATTPRSALGMSPIAALVDEIDFMPKKKRRRDVDRFGIVDMSKEIYDSISRRISSRYGRYGKLFLPCSKTTEDSFLGTRIKEAETDSTVFVRDYALWEAKPAEYSEKKFYVLCGNEQINSRILEDQEVDELRENLPDRTTLLDVPMDFIGKFTSDLEGSIRDLGGVSTVAYSPFFQRRQMIWEMEDEKMVHPYSEEVYRDGGTGRFLYDKVCRMYRELNVDEGTTVERPVPILHPSAPRHVHIDPSLNQCSAGFCMGHQHGTILVKRIDNDLEVHEEEAPMYFIDLILEMVPPVNSDLEFALYRQIIYDLTKNGYPIYSVSMDSWQSRDGLQVLEKRGYKTTEISMDRTWEPYQHAKSVVYERRVKCYKYERLFKQLQRLEVDWNARKVIKPVDGSKDLADGFAGCLYGILHQPTIPSMLLMMNEASSVGPDGVVTKSQEEIMDELGIDPNSVGLTFNDMSMNSQSLQGVQSGSLAVKMFRSRGMW